MLNPNSALASGLGAVVHVIAGDYARAINEAQCSLRLSPLDPMRHMPLTALAETHLETGRADLALRYAGQSLRAQPAYHYAHCMQIVALVNLARLDEARAAAERLQLVNPALGIVNIRRTKEFIACERAEPFLTALREAGLPERPPV